MAPTSTTVFNWFPGQRAAAMTSADPSSLERFEVAWDHDEKQRLRWDEGRGDVSQLSRRAKPTLCWSLDLDTTSETTKYLRETRSLICCPAVALAVQRRDGPLGLLRGTMARKRLHDSWKGGRCMQGRPLTAPSPLPSIERETKAEYECCMCRTSVEYQTARLPWCYSIIVLAQLNY